jgi:hypothetical protein
MQIPSSRVSGERVVYLVEERANPSTDFFILPALLAANYRVIHCGFTDLPEVADLTGAVVVFVRYVSVAWAKLINAVRPQLATLVFFMDDDILDYRASAGTPWDYRLKLAWLATRHSRWLRQQRAELWVSVPYLQQKYADWQPRLILPAPVANPVDLRKVFYHGSAITHKADIHWLRPVIEEVLHRDSRIIFELIGDADTCRLYKNLPRVNVVRSMRWPAYQAFLSTQTRHVGLNPLRDVPFNRARSYTKFFDITRCDAVGIYTPNSTCSTVVQHQQEGLVVELEQDAWISAILMLVQDEALRQRLLRNAQAKTRELAEQAQRGYVDLLS